MNMRLIIAVGLCFGLGTGTGATWSAKKAEAGAARETALQAASDSTAATSHESEPDGAAPSANTESGHPEPSIAPAAMEQSTDTAREQGGHESGPPETTPAAAATPDTSTSVAELADSAHATPALPDSLESGTKEDAGRPSRIFGAMRPEEAARILQALDDRAALSVLLGLTDRKAAAILSNIKGERAAALARALLNHEGVR